MSAESMERLSSSAEKGVTANGAWLRANAAAHRLQREDQELDTDDVFESSEEEDGWESQDDDREWRCQKVDVAF